MHLLECTLCVSLEISLDYTQVCLFVQLIDLARNFSELMVVMMVQL